MTNYLIICTLVTSAVCVTIAVDPAPRTGLVTTPGALPADRSEPIAALQVNEDWAADDSRSGTRPDFAH